MTNKYFVFFIFLFIALISTDSYSQLVDNVTRIREQAREKRMALHIKSKKDIMQSYPDLKEYITITNYDINGYPLYIIYYNDNGVLSGKDEYSYDENNKLKEIKTIWFGRSDNSIAKYEYNYEGKISRKTLTHSEGNYETLYYYDEIKKTIKTVFSNNTDSNNPVVKVSVTNYDDNFRISSLYSFNKKGDTVSILNYSYENDMLIIKSHPKDNTIEDESVSIYDKNDNNLEQTSRKDGNIIYSDKNEFKYDDDQLAIETIRFTNDKIRSKNTYSYERFQVNEYSNINWETRLKEARTEFAKGNYDLVIELIKDIPSDNIYYNEALYLIYRILSQTATYKNLKYSTIYGNILDKNKNIVSGYVVVEDILTGIIFGKYKITPEGYYCLILPNGKSYSYYIESNGFYPQSRFININPSSQSVNVQDNIEVVSLADMIEKGLPARINNIFFNFNEFNLKSESYPELERLYYILFTNSNINVEISGYTDNVGSDDYNVKLSNSRAKSVKDYLLAKGINTNRIISKGYGKLNPVATNNNEEGRQQNRRVEFKILKK